MRHETTSQNTKKMILDTFVELLELKPISKITVSEIVNKCQINRKTFYYHFTDIYDLLEWFLNDRIQETLDDFDLVDDFEQIISVAKKYIDTTPCLAHCADDPIGSEKLVYYLTQKLQPLLLEVIHHFEIQNNKQLDESYKLFISELFSKSSALHLVDVLREKSPIDYTQYSTYISITLHSALEGILIKMGH